MFYSAYQIRYAIYTKTTSLVSTKPSRHLYTPLKIDSISKSPLLGYQNVQVYAFSS